ncbi:hypothetical protein JW926_07655 [Candidatus Sumerlaeota bacterium]|nr:hypothetical protein [Candidatus Sumerlaeota bacterium]
MNTYLIKRFFLFYFLFIILDSLLFGQSEWVPSEILPLRNENYSFLTSTPSGDLLAATFNVLDSQRPPQELSVFLIKNPMDSNPSIVTLIKHPFSSQRGYGGLACDDQGNIYLSADTGDSSTCFVRKFYSDGSLDISFGNHGEIKPKRRCLGLDVLGNYLILAVDWGEIRIYNAMNGQYTGSLPTEGLTGDLIYIRDIAIEPASLKILGVSAGCVVAWEGGAPWNPQAYKCRIIARHNGIVRSGEGISIDPIKRCALVTPVRGNKLFEVFDERTTLLTSLTKASPDTHLVDSVVSFDGNLLFVSDLLGKKIHVLRRDARQLLANEYIPSVAYPSAATPVEKPIQATPLPPAAQISEVQWHRSYLEILETARNKGVPMILYFRRANFPACEALEKNIILTNDFNSRARNFYCVFEDVSVNRLLAYRFGVFRIPCIIVLDGKGQIVAKFIKDIRAEFVFHVLESTQR